MNKGSHEEALSLTESCVPGAPKPLPPAPPPLLGASLLLENLPIAADYVVYGPADSEAAL